MKEVTYEEWQKNPTPRMMWCWNFDEDHKVKVKVIHLIKGNCVNTYPVIAVVEDDSYYQVYKHCAEIEKQRRMTNKELSRWLREKPTREYTHTYKEYIGNWCDYTVDNQDREVTEDVFIREDDGEWREPLV